MKLGVVMDRIESITPYKDSTFAMLLETQARGWPIFYMQQADLYLRHNQARATMKSLGVQDNSESWSEYGDDIDQSLDALDVILMRKDPPFNMDYIYTTYLLELAEKAGTLIVNKPQSLRDANEKLFTAWFPQCTPESLVTADADRIRAFLAEYKDIILKPLDGMG
ncbi:MAG TPA: glutathione synthase, partial [Acidiferrobacteraceae bacterium]|nr:glutathione synthase [Acidiferrobacteraceae bacterium]HEX19814.1 glutathione synthase [Acidiferrobacteraceae bacterium]